MTLKHDPALLFDISSVLSRMGIITVNAGELQSSGRDHQASLSATPLPSKERLRLLEDIEYGAPEKIIQSLARLSQNMQRDDLPFIAHTLTHKNPGVRKAAAGALGASGLREALPIIEKALHNDLHEDVLEALLQSRDSITGDSSLDERVLKTIHRTGALCEAVMTVFRSQEGGNASLMIHLMSREDFHRGISDVYVVLNEITHAGSSHSPSRICLTDSRGRAVFENLGPGSYSLRGRNATSKPSESVFAGKRAELAGLLVPAAADEIVFESVILHLSSDDPQIDCAITVRCGSGQGLYDAEVFVALIGAAEGTILNYRADWESDRPAFAEGSPKLYNTGECLEGKFNLSGLTLRDIETMEIRFAWDAGIDH